MRFSPRLGLMALLAAAASAQTAETPHFEVAEVDVSPHEVRPMTQGPFFTGGRYEVRQASMLDLIRMAYGVDPERVYGGPSWLEMDRFDVFARRPARRTRHRERSCCRRCWPTASTWWSTRTTSRWRHSPSRSRKSRCSRKRRDRATRAANSIFRTPSSRLPSPSGGPSAIALPVFVYTCHNTTMAAFASGLLDIPGAAQYFGNRPVVDQTGLEGAWDFTLEVHAEGAGGSHRHGRTACRYSAPWRSNWA